MNVLLRAVAYGLVLAACWGVITRSPLVVVTTAVFAPVAALEARPLGSERPRADAALVTSLVFAVIELYRRAG